MNIKYPHLVEDAYKKLFKAAGKTKAETYNTLLEAGLIHEDGTPTQKAIDDGLVTPDIKATRIEQEKANFPKLRQFDDAHFSVIGNKVYVDDYVRLELAKQTLKDPFATGRAKAFARKEIEYLDKQ